MDDATAWEIEDLTEARSGLGAGHTNRWFGVAIAVLAAVVGLGFIGRSATGPEVATIVAPQETSQLTPAFSDIATSSNFTLSAPVSGTTAEGGLVAVRGTAHRALGTLHVAVRLGDAILGWTNLAVRAAGHVEATIRVFAPPFDAPARLTIESAGVDEQPRVDIAVDIRLRGVAGPLCGSRGSVPTTPTGRSRSKGSGLSEPTSTSQRRRSAAGRSPDTTPDRRGGDASGFRGCRDDRPRLVRRPSPPRRPGRRRHRGDPRGHDHDRHPGRRPNLASSPSVGENDRHRRVRGPSHRDRGDPPVPGEAALVARAQAGDQVAFEALLAPRVDRLLRLTWSIVVQRRRRVRRRPGGLPSSLARAPAPARTSQVRSVAVADRHQRLSDRIATPAPRVRSARSRSRSMPARVRPAGAGPVARRRPVRRGRRSPRVPPTRC